MSTVRAHDDRHAVVGAPLVAPRYYVRTEPLRALVVSFIDRWSRERPAVRASRGETGRWAPGSAAPFVTAIDYLAAETGLSRSTIVAIQNGTKPTALESTADVLVAALGCPQAFHDGTLEVGLRRNGQFVPLDD